MFKQVALNSFVKRQSPDSPFAHFIGTWDHLLEIVEDNLDEKQPGDKEHSWLVPIPDMYVNMFLSSVTPLFPSLDFKVQYQPRREGEEPFLNVTVPGHKVVAKCAHIVIYEHDLLGKDAETDAPYEVVAILASPTEERTPTDPVTMMRNYLERPGGTKAEYTAEEFAKSILFWSQHAMIDPI